MRMHARMFTLDEASDLLPKIETLLNAIIRKKESCERLHDRLLMHDLIAASTPQGSAYDPGHLGDREAQILDESVASIEKDLEMLATLGCVLRNLEHGCVDFPAMHRGEFVYYCWKRGESAIHYFHAPRTSSFERIRME